MDFSKLKDINQGKLEQADKQVDKAMQDLAGLRTQEVFVKSIQSLANLIANHTTHTVVENQIQGFATSKDAQQLGVNLQALLDELRTHENTDVSPVVDALNEAVAELRAIPKEHNEVVIPEQVDYSERFEELLSATNNVLSAIKSQKTIVQAPNVKVEAPNVQVEAPDLKPLGKDLEKSFRLAIKSIVFPETKDYSKVLTDQLKEQRKTNQILQELPTGGSGGGSGSIAPFLVDGALPITGSITASSSTLADFSVNDIEEDTTSYFGSTKPDGTWLIKSLTDTSVGYATVTNNVSVTSYTDAWTDRTTLTYGRFDQAF